MQYRISYTYPHKHFIDIELVLDNLNVNTISLHLPAWRPGRYELQNYAKNIVKFDVRDANNQKLNFEKSNRNNWLVNTEGKDKIIVSYSYFAKQMDAGGSWLDENQLYINFINCLVYSPVFESNPCTVELVIPDEYKIACGIKPLGKKISANDYFELIDCPLIASKTLQTHTFAIHNYQFSIHIQGECTPEWKKITSDFSKFVQSQIRLFGDFPEKDYHFLFQILPYKHYHGVEHRNSTVITLGPNLDFDKPTFYKNILGISSHELFHTWNICKIRPVEMMPYRFDAENYFPTGFVAEGITTYYGDLMLARAGVWDAESYFEGINENLQKHIENPARNFVSLVNSSIDLWVDGYQPSNPFRKVSIYDKGALVALILDLEIRRATQSKKTLDDVMRQLWSDFGKKGIGYSIENYKSVAENVAGISMDKYFEDCIYGTTPLERILSRSLDYVGCVIEMSGSVSRSEDHFGIRAKQKEAHWLVEAIATGSPADKALDLGDAIIEVNRQKITTSLDEALKDNHMAEFTILRDGKIIHRVVLRDGGNYFLTYKIAKNTSANALQKEQFELWMK